MSDRSGATDGTERPAADSDGLRAGECEKGHLTFPPHPVCPTCGEPQSETVDLSTRTGTVVTWTTSTTTPPGVREPNTLAIVAFEVGDRTVRALGGTTGDVDVGDAVRPVYVAELRDPEASFRTQASQRWDGYRFAPVEE